MEVCYLLRHVDYIYHYKFLMNLLYLHSEDLRESICQLLYPYFSIVDTVAGVESIKKFNQVCCFACPIEFLSRSDWQGRKKSLHSHLQ